MVEEFGISYQKYNKTSNLPYDVGRIMELQRGSATVLSVEGQFTAHPDSHLIENELQFAIGDWCTFSRTLKV